MTVFNVLSMIGGLALFLFGMKLMGEALEKRAGTRLKRVLERMTASPLRGVLFGAGVTAVIQSSSAMTVMVVGFVNSGVMQLRQAIGVIMGANVGTTITAWILSLTSISGESLFVNLLKPSSFTPILALIGIIMLFSKGPAKRHDLGMALLGFSVLMFGMETMSTALRPLAEVPAFAHLLTLFKNPLLGVLAGALLTGIIQSSSASVGILQALSVTGAVTYASAIPIIFGQNIGTTVTALLSSIGTSKNARRAAVVHLYFNVIGTIVFLTLFYVLNSMLQFSFYTRGINAVGIAIIHTAFNLLSTALMLPMTGLLERLARLTIRDRPADSREEELAILDERLLASPPIALDQCRVLASAMAQSARDSLLRALRQLNEYSEQDAVQILEDENYADMYEDKLGSFLVQLSSRNLSQRNSREVSLLLHCIGDFERVSDHAVNILDVAREVHEKKVSFSEETQNGIQTACSALTELLTLTVGAFCEDNLSAAGHVEPLEQVIDYLVSETKRRHILRLQSGQSTVELGFILSDLLVNLERTADHCSNVAVCMIELARGSFDTHGYLNSIKDGSDQSFTEQYRAYLEKYKL